MEVDEPNAAAYGVVYVIANLVNQKMYVGQTTMNPPEKRWHAHCSARSTSLISRAIRKYGPENFLFCVIDTTPTNQDELNQRELYWSTLLHTWTDSPDSWGYNVKQCGGAHGRHALSTSKKISEAKQGKYTGSSNPFFGHTHSEEVKSLLSRLAKGRWQQPEYRAAHSVSPSDEARKKISQSLKEYYAVHPNPRLGVTLSAKTRRKIGDRPYPSGRDSCWYGRHHTEETKKKISNAKKGTGVGPANSMYGKKHSEESKQKMRASFRDQTGEKNVMFGKKHSPETRQKMPASHADVSGSNNPRATKVMCIETGQVFDCMKDAAASVGVSKSQLSTYFSKHKPTCGGKTWKKL